MRRLTSGFIPEVAFITYVNSLDDTETRRDQLSKTWHFLCDCSLCENTKSVESYLVQSTKLSLPPLALG